MISVQAYRQYISETEVVKEKQGRSQMRRFRARFLRAKRRETVMPKDSYPLCELKF